MLKNSIRMLYLHGSLGLVFAIVFIAGCSPDTDGRVAVSGTVRLGGELINRGSIELHPKDSSGLHSGGVIRDGRYKIDAMQGPRPGVYDVKIFAASERDMEPPPDGPGDSRKVPVAKERVPPKYNTATTLTVTIKDSGNDAVDYDLDSK